MSSIDWSNLTNFHIDMPYNAEPFKVEPFNTKPFKVKPFNAKPFNAKPFNAKPFKVEPFNAKPFKVEPFNAKPFMTKPFMTKPFMTKPFKVKPFMSKTFESKKEQSMLKQSMLKQSMIKQRLFKHKKYIDRTLIILDWDDTLFPTSWTVKNSIDLANPDVQNKYIVFFAKLDMLLHKFLTNILKHGRVIIVTNAMGKWVSISSNILPNTQRLIKDKIPVVSARDKFQKMYPNNGFAWKKLTFQELVSEYYMGVDDINDRSYTQNIVSVGDADYEFRALIDLYDHRCTQNNKEIQVCPKRYLKSVRFMSSPSYDTLIDQLEVLNKSVDKIIESKKHMDLKFDGLNN